MIRKSLGFIGALAVAALAAAPAQAQSPTIGPMVNPANGHSYALYDRGSISWTSARDFATSVGGHLVTIADADEQAFVTTLLAMYRDGTWSGWIGLTDEVIEGEWQWVTGEPVTYTNWQFGEPNDLFGGEDYVQMVGVDNGAWNDHGNDAGFNTFHVLVEFEGGSSCPCEFDEDPAQVNIFDLLAFLNAWFALDSQADMDGNRTVDIFDLLQFLDCWFPASTGGDCVT